MDDTFKGDKFETIFDTRFSNELKLDAFSKTWVERTSSACNDPTTGPYDISSCSPGRIGRTARTVKPRPRGELEEEQEEAFSPLAEAPEES